MSREENKAIMRRFVNLTDPAKQKALLAPNFVLYRAGRTHNRDEFLQHMASYQTAFGDTRFVVEEQVAEGEKVVTRGTYRGVHTGDFQGLPPSGEEIAIDAVLFDRIEDGKIVEHRSLFDVFALMQQLGAVPPPQPASERTES